MISTEAATAVAVVVLLALVLTWVVLSSLLMFLADVLDLALWVLSRRGRRGLTVIQRGVGR